MEWKGIETAPRDRYFLAFCPDFYDTDIRGDQGMAVCYYSRDGALCFAVAGSFAELEDDDEFCDGPYSPTHWMPLPEPPNEELNSERS